MTQTSPPAPLTLTVLPVLLGLALTLAAAPLAGCSSCSTPSEEAAGEADGAAGGERKRRGPAVEVELLAPGGAMNTGEPIIFRWEGPGDKPVVGWTLTVMARPDIPLWTSPEQAGQELEAPPELLNRLEPGQVYTWRVVGRLEAGGRVRSEPGRLVLAPSS